jgi:hypothetical protein
MAQAQARQMRAWAEMSSPIQLWPTLLRKTTSNYDGSFFPIQLLQALYQGTTSVVPEEHIKLRALAPATVCRG